MRVLSLKYVFDSVAKLGLLFVICLHSLEVRGVGITPRDTIVIDGRPLSISAHVEIDTVKINHTPKWIDDAELVGVIRVNADILGLSQYGVNEQGLDFYRVINNNHLPEIGLELNHKTSINQLHYRFGGTIGLAIYFDESEVDDNAIGFDWSQNNLTQILIVHDDLENESDTVSVPIKLSPQVKLSLGMEWHGVMRYARGWIVGGAVELTTVKDKVSRLYEVSSDNPGPDAEEFDWGDINSEDTFYLESESSSFLQFRLYASWSPWNMPIFIRGEVSLGQVRTDAGLAIGYRW